MQRTAAGMAYTTFPVSKGPWDSYPKARMLAALDKLTTATPAPAAKTDAEQAAEILTAAGITRIE